MKYWAKPGGTLAGGGGHPVAQRPVGVAAPHQIGAATRRHDDYHTPKRGMHLAAAWGSCTRVAAQRVAVGLEHPVAGGHRWHSTPVRFDIEAHAAGYLRAMSHLSS